MKRIHHVARMEKERMVWIRRFLILAGLTVLAANIALAADRPNIIWIMADDLGYAELGCYGQELLQTPHIDRMAAEGMRFTRCYAGSTVCAPSRCCLMTGKHTGNATVRGNAARTAEGAQPIPLRDEDVTVAEVLGDVGYVSGVTGKWGLGEPGTSGTPNEQGFDQWLGYLNQRHAHGFFPEFIWNNDQMMELTGNLGGGQRDWVHDRFTQFALDFIARHHTQPFFLYVAYTIPHGRYEIPSDRPYSDRPWPQKVKNHAAMITRMDADVGKIFASLQRLKIDQRTIVFFTSDNGAEIYYYRQSNEIEDYVRILKPGGSLRGFKRDLTEGGIRVPMIVRWPGKVTAGSVSEFPWAFWDFLPTAAELAGVDAPGETDGQSILPTLLGKSQRPAEYLYWEFFERGFQQAALSGRWKAIRNAPTEPVALYDLETDIGESRDMAAQRPEVARRMTAYLDAARTPSPYWPQRR
jgi:arylsulfatase A-like enzyme